MGVTGAKELLTKIQDLKKLRLSICQVLGSDYVGIVYLMLTMRLLCSKCQSMIPLKDILMQLKAIFNIIIK